MSYVHMLKNLCTKVVYFETKKVKIDFSFKKMCIIHRFLLFSVTFSDFLSKNI